MTKMTENSIYKHLKQHRSYFKWSATRLAEKFGCSVKTINSVIQSMDTIKRNYLKSFK